MASLPLAGVDLFAVLLVFARIGTAIVFLPGFSAAYVSMRIRLLLALAISVLVAPALTGVLPPIPQTPWALGLLLLGEATVGLFLGNVVRIAFAALQTAGTFTAFLSSFANALSHDPVVEEQSSTVAGFFTTLGVVMVFAAHLDHLMLRSLVDSYGVFTPGNVLPLGDFADSVARDIARSFALGVQLAAPFLLVSLVYNVGLGLLGRLMPQLQVFFFGLPIQLSLQIWVMALTISGIMMIFLDRFGETVAAGWGG